MALSTDENDNLVPERAAEIAELKRQGEMEALMMSLEGITLTLSNINAQLRLVDGCIEADLSKPILTDAELKVQQDMMKSIAERILKLGQIAAQIEGTPPPPTEGNVAEILQAVMDEAKAHYGVDGAGTQEDSIAPAHDDLIDAASHGITYGGYPVNDDGSVLMEDGSTLDVNIPSEYDVHATDDTTADEDTEIMFKTTRNPASEIELTGEGGPLPVPFDTQVFTDFPKVDFRNQEEREKMMAHIIDFYVTMCAAAHQSGMISEDFALRLAQEIHMVPADEVENPDIEMPMPGTIADDIASRASQGETVTTYLVADHLEVGEVIIASFMTTMAFFNSRVSAAYLEDRLAAIGMSA